MEYRHKTSPRPTPRKFKVVASARSSLPFFWDMEGVVYMGFLEQGQTVNSERYISTLQALKLRLRRVRRDKDSMLQHDNAHPHTCQSPNSGNLKAAGTYDPTTPCIQLRSCPL
ncbi:histone-lysine N-methyltransferase SETMAR [Plakobranchus ocellatus]|uniref:Histone-lysine N-methyltransferase SETMAR n=1 Tax=Plakobranchus ocellatus TaxID=259542 RepID=A0AAV3Y3C1_9GAST|nr:histone-lysine N-methyltransferase SETMAR [Plakobranchus ocellatus]